MKFNPLIWAVVFTFFFSCSEDNDMSTPRNLQEYLDTNPIISSTKPLAFAASDQTDLSKIYIYYFPTSGATDVRYYETDSINIDNTNFSLYRRRILSEEILYEQHFNKFTRTDIDKEKWCLVTYLSNGELFKSDIIRLKQLSKPTEWKDTVRIEYPISLKPKFSWDDGAITENISYFETISDITNTLFSATFTTEKWLQYGVFDNVTETIHTETPPSLVLEDAYNFTTMGISSDYWVNLIIEKSFVAE